MLNLGKGDAGPNEERLGLRIDLGMCRICQRNCMLGGGVEWANRVIFFSNKTCQGGMKPLSGQGLIPASYSFPFPRKEERDGSW